MVDLANSGAAPPMITGPNAETGLLALQSFRDQQDRDRKNTGELKVPLDIDVSSTVDALMRSLPDTERVAMKLRYEPAFRRMLSERQSLDYVKKFRNLWERRLYVYEDDEELLALRDDLREVFETGEAMKFLSKWGGARARKRSDPGLLRIVQVQLYGKQFPLPEIDLRLVISMAILASLPRMTRCANPECPSPYFLRSKKTQRFCERPACAAYGQRQHKLNWWRTHGKARRAAMKTAQNEQQKKKRSAVNTRRRHKRQ